MELPGCAVCRLRSRWGVIHARECACAEPRYPEDLEGTVLHQIGCGNCLTVHPYSADPQRRPGRWAVITTCCCNWRVGDLTPSLLTLLTICGKVSIFAAKIEKIDKLINQITIQYCTVLKENKQRIARTVWQTKLRGHGRVLVCPDNFIHGILFPDRGNMTNQNMLFSILGHDWSSFEVVLLKQFI